jgi:uncharacterized protein with von Willebrand factor type A (vWA) domain
LTPPSTRSGAAWSPPVAAADGTRAGPSAECALCAKDAALDFSWTESARKGAGRPPGVSDLDSTGAHLELAADLAEVERLAQQIARRLATRRSRRLPSRRRGRVDLRRTVRLSLMRGELIDLARRERKILKTKLVIFCDVSGSMDLYSRLLLQFLYAMQNQLGRMETFVFSTRLHRITEDLRHASYRGALSRLGDVRDWSGGTKIGDLRPSMQAGPGSRHRSSLSDGWDTGIRRSGRGADASTQASQRLNPLGARPPAPHPGMQAIPHVDASRRTPRPFRPRPASAMTGRTERTPPMERGSGSTTTTRGQPEQPDLPGHPGGASARQGFGGSAAAQQYDDGRRRAGRRRLPRSPRWWRPPKTS